MRKVMLVSALPLALALAGASAEPASALMHAMPGQHWTACGRVLGHRVGVTQPGTSCALGRNAARTALLHHPFPFRAWRMYGRHFGLRAYSGVTRKWYRLRASGSYRTQELGIWCPRARRLPSAWSCCHDGRDAGPRCRRQPVRRAHLGRAPGAAGRNHP